MQKIYLEGTHRVRSPSETLSIAEPLMPNFGVTRLADVTGLDVIGIPVYMSIRPMATTLSVSQGKGKDRASAKVSALMEAYELWHAERAVPQAKLIDVPSTGLDLGYDLLALQRHPGSLLTYRTKLDWICGNFLCSGRQTFVPRDAVRIGLEVSRDWHSRMLAASSNGLASGNTFHEAVNHALYEIIERDATGALGTVAAEGRTYIAVKTIDDPHCAELIERIAASGAWIEILDVPSRFSIPTFVCYLWHEDFGGTMVAGSGTHTDPSVALSRAITEAVQSRLTFISGVRDDISPLVYRLPSAQCRPPSSSGRNISWTEVTERGTSIIDDDELETQWLAERVTGKLGSDPIAVELSTCEEFKVAKVLCPGTGFRSRHDIPR